jgi:hypothetical protein
MQSMRKFWLTLVGLGGFIAIILLHPQIDPISLGLGLGFLLSPMAVSNVYEHKYAGSGKTVTNGAGDVPETAKDQPTGA